MKLEWDDWDDRAEDFKANADYYVACYRQDYGYIKAHSLSLDELRYLAKEKANEIKRPIMLYAVKILSDPYGSDSWIENVMPDKV